MAVSTALANAMLGGLPGSSYVQIHSGDPGPSGVLNVIAGPGRALVTLPAASGGQRALLTNVDVPSVPQGASVAYVSYWDAPSGGNFSHSEALGVTVTFAYAGTLRFTSQTFTVTTAASGAQTATSVVADTSSASDSVVTVLKVAVADTVTSAETASTAIPHVDIASTADANTIRLGVVVGDSSSMADTAIGNSGGVSTNLDTASIADSVGITQATLTANMDMAAAADSNTASQVAGGGTTVTDDFNRADGGLGANWTTALAASAPTITSNQVKPPNQGIPFAALYTGYAFTANQFARAKITNAQTRVVVRGSTSANTGYRFGWRPDQFSETGEYFFTLEKVVNGTVTTLREDYGSGMLGGGADVFELSVVGTNLTAKVNGATIYSNVPDSSIASGSPGFWMQVGLQTLDDFQAGNL